ncbi:hypothetical protein A3770_18p82430 [Chloropicon primus]|uniref:Uncharacterized protein n=1 Tax=Chloropicon primus TaxID=1764295 RepID=A0A5B8N1H1_9CHLO|nr:hypothetical protein A3770_18p82430 [Chloropicon primus]|eukprot:QDZ25725.1 hypothetical protein A3770_18p82430 [Chloropicon primus]
MSGRGSAGASGSVYGSRARCSSSSSSPAGSCIVVGRRKGKAAAGVSLRSQEEDRSDFPPEFREDPWADEKFNVVGLLFQNFIYVAILLTGLAGGLAAKSYNDGATFFLQKATSDADSAQVISLEEVQRARNLPPAATSAPQVAAPE